MDNIKIVIVRTSTLILDFKTYNCQELGLAKALSKKGYKVSIITPDIKSTHYKEYVDNGEAIDIYTVKFIALNRNICWHYNVDSILKEIKPNIIHINSFSLSMSFWYQIWAKRHNVKTVVVQGNYETTHKIIFKQLETIYNKTFGRYLLKHTNAVGGKTNWACSFTKKYCECEPLLTRIGLDIERFSRSQDVDWCNKLGINNKKRLLYVGAQEPRRNPMFLIKIISQLPNDYILLLVGNGPSTPEVNKYIDEFKLNNRVFQLGKISQDKLPSLYKSCDLFLLPSNYEIFGMVILEAMFFHLPVISTLTAGADAIIDNNLDSIIIPNLNVNEWTKKIIEIMETPSYYKKLSKAAYGKVVNHLTWDKTAEEFISLYKKALNG